jgi:hypothetical protein
MDAASSPVSTDNELDDELSNYSHVDSDYYLSDDEEWERSRDYAGFDFDN